MIMLVTLPLPAAQQKAPMDAQYQTKEQNGDRWDREVKSQVRMSGHITCCRTELASQ